MPPDSNLEQRKNVWLKQLRYLLDIDSLIGLKSVFDRIPRKQETAHDSPLTGPHPSDHGWCSFIQQTLIKGFWWAWLMLLALPVQLYSWCSYRTRRQEKREAWVSEFVPVCLMSFLRRKKNPSKPVGEPRWRWFSWGSKWLSGGGMLVTEGLLMVCTEALRASKVTALNTERTPWPSFKDFVTVTWTPVKVTSEMVAEALWGIGQCQARWGSFVWQGHYRYSENTITVFSSEKMNCLLLLSYC